MASDRQPSLDRGTLDRGTLDRGIGVFQASTANMLQMIGIGPFITLPILLAAMPGPQALLGWFVAGLISMADGLVWAELGAAMPGVGGPYHYLKQAYGPNRLGKLMAFVYIWETVLSAPLSIAGGAVGVSLYLKFYWPSMSLGSQRMVAIAVCLVCTALLYREIRSVGWLSVAMWVVVMFKLTRGDEPCCGYHGRPTRACVEHGHALEPIGRSGVAGVRVDFLHNRLGGFANLIACLLILRHAHVAGQRMQVVLCREHVLRHHAGEHVRRFVV